MIVFALKRYRYIFSAISLEAFPGRSFYGNPVQPPKLYAKITSEGKPVLRANVIAIITRCSKFSLRLIIICRVNMVVVFASMKFKTL